MPKQRHARIRSLSRLNGWPQLYSLSAFLVAMSCSVWAESASAPDFTPDQLRFFEEKIRPILSERCYECHSEEKQKGGLLLTDRPSILTGGDSGPAFMPGMPENSLIIEAIRYRNSDFQMPPKGKLSDREINLLTQWISQGAPWPQTSTTRRLSNSALNKEFEITEEDRSYWAFRPIKRPQVSFPNPGDASDTAIDQIIVDNLNKKGLSPVPRADRRTLIRRAYFDLLGLPPDYDEIETFVNDPRPNAFEHLVEGLLARPEYGERYGRHWLDVVRFAQTNGYERDDEKPLSWKYRDYVIQSFNQDKPYDQFVKEQLAGDELDATTTDSLIATGFFRLGVWDDEPDDRRAAEFDGLDDMLKTASETFLGLTVGCARCHDHMFDPISQRDYYELLSFFRNIRYYDRPRLHYDAATYLPLIDPRKRHQWTEELASLQREAAQLFEELTTPVRVRLREAKHNELTAPQKEALKLPTAERNEQQVIEARAAEKALEIKREELLAALPSDDRHRILSKEKQVEAFEKAPPWGQDDYALGVRESGPEPPTTHLLVRGNAGRPSDRVEPQFLTVLSPNQHAAPSIHRRETTSGRRRALAEWITSPDHPLTARVLVNRIWQYHFGQGLVSTPNDFGKAGVPPVYPTLLDWLATDFIEHGWSIKHLHKRIMFSAAYQRSSATQPHNQQTDPGNQYLWRQNLRRLEAEALRDAILSTAGTLNSQMGGRGFFPDLSSEVVAGGSRPGRGWAYSQPAEQHRRSVYTFIKRTMGVPLLEVFDYNNTEGSLGTRTTTTVAPQALTLLNDEFINQQAQALADQLLTQHPDNERELIHTAFVRTLARQPTPSELSLTQQFLQQQQQQQSSLQTQLTFRPSAPESLERGYLNSLPADRLLVPPNSDWQVFRGRWGNPYEGILYADKEQSPFTLWQPVSFKDGEIHGQILVEPATTRTGILIQAQPYHDSFAGYEIVLDHTSKTISICRQAPNRSTLATQPMALPRRTWLPFRISLQAGQVEFHCEGMTHPLTAEDGHPLLHRGHLGIRSQGGITKLAQAQLTVDGIQFGLSERGVLSDRRNGIQSTPLVPGWSESEGTWVLDNESSVRSVEKKRSILMWSQPKVSAATQFHALLNLSKRPETQAGVIVELANKSILIAISHTPSELRITEMGPNKKELKSAPLVANEEAEYELRLTRTTTSLAIQVNQRDLNEARLELAPGETIQQIGLLSNSPETTFTHLSLASENQAVRYRPHFGVDDLAPELPHLQPDRSLVPRAAVRELCSLLFNLNEFVYLD